MALRATQRLLSLSSLLCLVSAITNSQELARYQQLSQFRTYPDELTRSALSPQQQTHILSDVQHRFLVNPSQRQQPPQQQQHFQGQRPTPQQQGVDFGAIRQQVQQQYSTLPGSPSQPGFEPQPANYQPFPGQAFPNYQPQPALHNYNFNFPQQTLQQQQQPERKPVVLQPTYSKEDPTVHHQQQAPTNNYRQPSYRPQQPTQETYQQQFENYVVPEKQKDFISQVDPPKYSPEPEKQETPSWVLETQPPNLYKTQKPYDAITFATESYKVTTAAPRFVKYRPKAKPTEATKDEETSPLYIKHDRKKLYDQLVSSQSTARPRVTSPSTTASPPRSTTAKSSKSEEELLQEELQRQIQAQLSGKDDVFGTLKITLPGSLTSEQIANLPNLALGDKIDQYDIPTVGANGLPVVSKTKTSTKASTKPKTQVKTIVINQPTTTVKPPTVLFEELTKGVLPPGADFEVIRQKQDGGLEEVGKLKDLAQKKVTFVILEEQPDGSVKVQGVRGNEDGPTETKGEEVDSIIQKIQKGEIKLPPSAKKQPTNNTPDESVASPSYVKHVGKSESPRKRYTTKAPTAATTKKYKYQPPTRTSFLPTPSPTTERPAPVYKSTTTSLPPSFAETHFHIGTRTTASYQQPSASNSYHQPTASNNYHQPTASTSYQPPTGPAVYETPTSGSPVYQATPAPSQYSSLPALYNSLATATGGTASTGLELVTTSPSHFTSPTGSGSSQLTETLKKHGFYAMAKFLRQSGLETVLNETGPYTLFVPTDKAFRSLLVQLGGPDRAEIKFKENPRLLSGLLLHHVIPGSFKLESLQDEMTGVSLAGTQLRVNTYVTQDQEWNDVKTTTINGAKVLRDMSDVVVPQGLAHGVDRVMFPLPVGDILQTLQADREGRFSKFVKLLRETGVATMFTGSKTYTVFAPTDSAFPDGEVERLLENRANARALVLRHVTPGTLYSAGMLFYQLRDSMMASNQIQLSKEAGRVKVNNAQVVSRNIPTTNGVIHAVDTLL